MTPVVLEEMRGSVLVLTMNRPEARNALTPEMGDALHAGLSRAQKDPAVRAVVLTGANGAFCAGGDVKAMAAGRNPQMSLEQKTSSLRMRAEVSRLLHEMPKPTIAVIAGAAAGAGLAMAMACDFRVATARAKLTVAFSRVGLCGDYGATYFLTQIVGAARARELMMLCPLLTADQAHEIGLVHRVWPDDVFAEQAAAFVDGLAAGPTVSLGYIKQNINLAAVSDLAASLSGEAFAQARCMATEDHAEAAKAFVEKRAPVFRGV